MNRRFVLALAFVAALSTPVLAQDKSIVVASTTSTQDSGLFGHILPLFKAKTGIDVKVVPLLRMVLSAATISLVPLTPAGSPFGPTRMKSLYITA